MAHQTFFETLNDMVDPENRDAVKLASDMADAMIKAINGVLNTLGEEEAQVGVAYAMAVGAVASCGMHTAYETGEMTHEDFKNGMISVFNLRNEWRKSSR